MLIEFSVGNYRSFKETVTFSMVAAKISAKDKKLDEQNTFQADDRLKLLKSAAIYGANASGKSNLGKALLFMKSLILNSSKEGQATEEIPIESFRLSTETESKPSFFEIVFLMDGKVHRYGFEVNKKEVISEWLFYVPTIREVTLFQREKNIIDSKPAFKGGSKFKNNVRDNALFLSVAAQFNIEIAKQILIWLKNLNVVSGLDDGAMGRYTIHCLNNNKNRDQIFELIKKLDLGIDELEISEIELTEETIPKDLPKEIRDRILRDGNTSGISIGTIHRKYNAEGQQISIETFEMDEHESEGTQKLFAMAGPLVDTLENGRILVIDELDARLHPLITREIISLFNSNQTNPHNAQLIFMTHDTNILSHKFFRRDQIWFAEKDKFGATHLYSLAEYKIRNDASFESDYIQGRYGAVPFIGDLSHLIGKPSHLIGKPSQING